MTLTIDKLCGPMFLSKRPELATVPSETNKRKKEQVIKGVAFADNFHQVEFMYSPRNGALRIYYLAENAKDLIELKQTNAETRDDFDKAVNDAAKKIPWKFHRSKKEYTRQAGGTYRWNFELGREYDLGTQHGNIFGLNGEDVNATYIGRINGYHVFARKEGSDIYSYYARNRQVMWCGDGDGYWSTVNASSDGIVRDEKAKSFLEDRLKALERLRKKAITK